MKLSVEKSKRRDGIALLIVLGMLALLLVLAGTFSITMRTDRLGAGNYANNVQSKQIAQAALADAIERIEEEMQDSSTGGVVISSSYYPMWDIITSKGSGAGVKLAWGEALKHIPAALKDAAMKTNAYWEANDLTNSTATIVGKRAYMIVNCSGFLDANYSGGDPRQFGTNTYELQLQNLPEFPTPQDLSDFINDCDTDVKYESVAELVNLNKAMRKAYSQKHPKGDFVVNSYYPPEGGNSAVDLGDGTVNAIKNNKNNIVKAFKSMMPDINDQDAEFDYTALVDYIDKDNIPGNEGVTGNNGEFDMPNTEMVPMLNEFSLCSKQVFGGYPKMGWIRYLKVPPNIIPGVVGPNLVITLGVSVEWFYPYTIPNHDKFDIGYTVTGTIVVNGVSKAVNNLPVFRTSQYNNDTDQIFNVKFGKNTEYIYVCFPNPPSPTPPNKIPFSADLNITLVMKDTTTGKIVDSAPGNPNIDPGFKYSVSGDIINNIGVPINCTPKIPPEKVWATWDPRFNWKINDTDVGKTHWWNSGMNMSKLSPTIPDVKITPGKKNNIVQPMFDYAKINNMALDYDTAMHISNSGRLISVGELGHLLRGKQQSHIYKTIRLFDSPINNIRGDADPVNKYFKLGKKSVHGLVNVNTESEDVFATAFLNLPVAYTNKTPLTTSEIHNIYTNMEAYIIDKGPLKSLDDMAHIDWMKILPSPKWDSVKRDSLFALSNGLLGTRQNIFTIIVSGGSFSMGMGQNSDFGNWLGQQRAIAVVWRDPKPPWGDAAPPPDPKPPHSYKLLYFKWLED